MVAPAVLGAVLSVAIVVIHIVDQHGLPGAKDPFYIQVCYWVLEVGGVAAALLLLARRERAGWIIGVGVAAGPLLGYVLSRGPGLPNYSEDIGNWGEPLGVLSLVVEAALLVIAVTMLIRARSLNNNRPRATT